MMVNLNLTEGEEKLLEQYARRAGVSVNEYATGIVLEQMELEEESMNLGEDEFFLDEEELELFSVIDILFREHENTVPAD